jgi:hypothetical protein
MLYDFDLRKILRRSAPTWFRWPTNQSLAFALCRWLLRIEEQEFAPLRAAVQAEYGYNGLIHSLEIALNDRFDAVLRRITVMDSPQVAYLFYRDAADLPVERIGEASEPSLYSIMDAQQLSGALAYRSEFTIRVPDTIGVSAKAIFDYVDLYRLAGRRPQITWVNILFSYPTFYDQYDG